MTGLLGKVTASDLGEYFNGKYGFIEDVKVTQDSSFNDGVVVFRSVRQARHAYRDGLVMECWHCVRGERVQCHVGIPHKV